MRSTVTLPKRAREREAAAAVRELRPWIDRRLAEVSAARAAIERPPGPCRCSARQLRLREEPGRTRAHRRGDLLLVPRGPGRGAAIERWYRRAARAEVAARLEVACAALGTGYERLSIRDQQHALGQLLGDRARSRSTGACCSVPRRCSTTSSGTRPATSW